MEGDRTDDVSAPPSAAFQSTPSAWRETVVRIFQFRLWNISIHSLRMEGDQLLSKRIFAGRLFQSTPSAWRETGYPHMSFLTLHISIHSLRMEGDEKLLYFFQHFCSFQSTPSAWRETSLGAGLIYICIHFNPLPPHGGRLTLEETQILEEFISIHSLRMEGDRLQCRNADRYYISIHSLRMEGDLQANTGYIVLDPFQSTPSAWRETVSPRVFLHILVHFNPLPPYGGRPSAARSVASSTPFQSTPSVWRETYVPMFFSFRT